MSEYSLDGFLAWASVTNEGGHREDCNFWHGGCCDCTDDARRARGIEHCHECAPSTGTDERRWVLCLGCQAVNMCACPCAAQRKRVPVVPEHLLAQAEHERERFRLEREGLDVAVREKDAELAQAREERDAYKAQLFGERQAHQEHIAGKNAELDLLFQSRDRIEAERDEARAELERTKMGTTKLIREQILAEVLTALRETEGKWFGPNAAADFLSERFGPDAK